MSVCESKTLTISRKLTSELACCSSCLAEIKFPHEDEITNIVIIIRTRLRE